MFWKKFLDIITGAGIIEKILDKLPGVEKMSEAERAQVQLELEKATREAAREKEDDFRQFFIEYEGAAKDMPRAIQVLRGSVRPFITYSAFGFWVYGYLWLIAHPGGATAEIKEGMTMLYYLNLITLSFWFGEKLIQRTGLMNVLQKRAEGK